MTKNKKLEFNDWDVNVKINMYAFNKAKQLNLEHIGFGMFVSNDHKKIAISCENGNKLKLIDLNEMIDISESVASEKAKKMGLKHVGYGKYANPKNGKVVATSADGGKKLLKVVDKKQKKTSKDKTSSEESDNVLDVDIGLNDDDINKLMQNVEKIDYKSEGASIRGVASKLLLKLSGKNIEFNSNDIKIANNMVMTSNAASGRIYNKDKSSKYSLDGLSISNKEAKNLIVKHKKEIESSDDRLKLNILSNKTDSKKTGVTFKTSTVLSEVEKNNGSELFSDEQIKHFKNIFDFDISDVEFYGKKIEKPSDSIESIMDVFSSTLNSFNKLNVPNETKKYVEDLKNNVSTILNDKKLSDVNKLKILGEKLEEIMKNTYNRADKLGSDESSSFVKDYGEVYVYVKMLCAGKKVYIPSSGTFPIVDVVAVDANSVKINGISVKSSTGKTSSMGAVTSAKLYLTLLSKIDKKNAEYIQTLNNMNQSSIDKVDNISDKNIARDISQIRKLENNEKIDLLIKKLKFNEEDKVQIINRIKFYEEKYKGKKNLIVLYKELIYRKYCMIKMDEYLKNSSDRLSLDFGNITAMKNKYEYEKIENPEVKNFYSYDKYTPVAKFDGNTLVSASYNAGSLGFKYK